MVWNHKADVWKAARNKPNNIYTFSIFFFSIVPMATLWCWFLGHGFSVPGVGKGLLSKELTAQFHSKQHQCILHHRYCWEENQICFPDHLRGKSYVILKKVRHFREKWSLTMHLYLKQISASYFHWLRFHPGHRPGGYYLHSQFRFKEEGGGFHSITKQSARGKKITTKIQSFSEAF